ncbi:MAG: nuclear transport factor 2 family protein [Cyanobacteria bacterium P01_A01_bin.17]
MSAEQDVLNSNTAFYRAFEKKDTEAMASIWSQGTSSICIHPGREALRGWENIQPSWQKIFRNTAYLEIDTTIITTEINSGLAYVILIEKVLQVAQRQRLEARSMATNIFEQMGEKWYLVHHHGSPLAN